MHRQGVGLDIVHLSQPHCGQGSLQRTAVRAMKTGYHRVTPLNHLSSPCSFQGTSQYTALLPTKMKGMTGTISQPCRG